MRKASPRSCLITLLAAALAVLLASPGPAVAEQESRSAAGKNIAGAKNVFSVALDVGHSKQTPGALSARNRPEYEFNRKMALAVLSLLNKSGANRPKKIRAFIVAPNGEDISLHGRAELINGANPDLLISIHHDSVNPRYLEKWTFKGSPAQFCDRFFGYSIFVSDKNAKRKASGVFALILGSEMRKAGFIPSTHHLEAIEGEGRQPVDIDKGVYRHDGLVVLKETKSPALLLECGIIKNRGEEKLLRSRAYRRKMARTIRSAVEIFAAGAK